MHRREILDVLITGEKAVGAIVDDRRVNGEVTGASWATGVLIVIRYPRY